MVYDSINVWLQYTL